MGKNIYVSNKTTEAQGVNIVKVINENVGISESITSRNVGGTNIETYLDSLDRTINWSKAGVYYNASAPTQPWNGTKGIPTFDVDVDLTGLSSYGGYTLDNTGVSDSTSAINAAIAACSTSHAVLLPAGTYRVTRINMASRKVLRGELDADNNPTTILVCTGGISRSTGCIQFGSYGGNLPYISGVDISGGAAKGSNTITSATTPAIVAGRLICIDQTNTTDQRTNNNSGSYCGRGGSGDRLLQQARIVTAVTGNVLTLNLPLDYTIEPGRSPQYWYADMSSYIYNAGAENLKITFDGGVGNAFNLQGAVYCWVKNCEEENSNYKAIECGWRCFGCEFRHNYFHGSLDTGGDHGYGIRLYWAVDYCLVEDNIILDKHCHLTTEASCSSNVFGYNFCRDMHYIQNQPWTLSALIHHAPHPYMNLWEGNTANSFSNDYYFGSGSHQLVFRNSLDMLNPKYQASAYQYICAVHNEAYHWYSNYVGNILGCSTLATTYPTPTYHLYYNGPLATEGNYDYNVGGTPSIWMHGETENNTGPEANTQATTIMHGNYEYVNGSTVWEDDVEDHTLPNSFYLASKPSWFGTLTYPSIGPDVTGRVAQTPAAWRVAQGKYFADSPA